MWLLPVISPLCRFALRVFYRFTAAGERVVAAGPVLLVANHPNGLLDPAGVVAVAGRPVRFLAKAPLFTDPLVGWLVRAAGAIPVYRRIDPDAPMERNQESFRAAHQALWSGAALGLFPEGISHSAPGLEPLKTGAARIALGAAARDGRAFPVHPVGLHFRQKGRFRSEALAVVGGALAWEDLAGRGDGDADAVRELTRRMEEGLRQVTLNLERWEDAPVVEAALDIYAAELDLRLGPAERVAALREVSEGLGRLRRGAAPDWETLARAVRAHARELRVLGLDPQTLGQPAPGAALRWTVRQLVFFALLGPPALIGVVALYPPYRATGWLVGRFRFTPDAEATYKVLVGAVVFSLWLALATAAVAGIAGLAGAAVPPVLALLGLAATRVHDRWTDAGGALRRYLTRSRRSRRLAQLRMRQRVLAERLAHLRRWVAA